MKEEPVRSKKLELELNHIKDLILHSRDNVNADIVIKIQVSRFKFLLRQIRDYNGITDESYVDKLSKEYDVFTINSSEIGDKNNNQYRVEKDFALPDKETKCAVCDCGKKRSINAKSGNCFYKEFAINYTTKLK